MQAIQMEGKVEPIMLIFIMIMKYQKNIDILILKQMEEILMLIIALYLWILLKK